VKAILLKVLMSFQHGKVLKWVSFTLSNVV
jgi:hypothetical protein